MHGTMNIKFKFMGLNYCTKQKMWVCCREMIYGISNKEVYIVRIGYSKQKPPECNP